MTDPRPDEATKLQEIIDAATQPDEDTEEKLARLERMILARREDPELKRQYEALRDEMARDILENGPRYLIGANGTKEYAYAVQPENIITSIEVLEQMVVDGELPVEVLHEVAPRKVDKEALRRAIAAKRLTNAQIVRAVKFRPGTAYVKFASPDDVD